MNRRLIRRTAAMGLAGALALGLAACGGPTGGASTGDGRELTYWSMWKEGEPQQKALSAAIEDFTAETGIEVDVQWQGRDVLKKLQPTLHGVPAADLVDRSLPQVKSMMVSTGTAADLTGVLKEPIPGEPGRTVGDVVPAKYLELGRAEGKQVVLPYAIVANGLWYDGASFPGLREKPPKDWDAFRATLAAEKKAGRAPLALDADIPDYGAYWYSNFVVGAMGPGSLHEAAADRTGTVWKQPGYVRAAERVAALAEDGYFADGYDASKFPAIQQKWATGKAGFLLMGSWIAGETKPYAASGFDFRMLPFPTDGAPGAGNARRSGHLRLGRACQGPAERGGPPLHSVPVRKEADAGLRRPGAGNRRARGHRDGPGHGGCRPGPEGGHSLPHLRRCRHGLRRVVDEDLPPAEHQAGHGQDLRGGLQ